MKSLKNRKDFKKKLTKIKSKRSKKKILKKKGGRFYAIKLDITDLNNGHKKQLIEYLEQNPGLAIGIELIPQDNGENAAKVNSLKKSNLVTIYLSISDRIKFQSLIEYINGAFEDDPTIKFKFDQEIININMNQLVRDFFHEQEGNNVRQRGPIIKLKRDFD